jgi:hypothetical protein
MSAPTEHITVGWAAFNGAQPGGNWGVECLCGWTDRGTFARSTPMALRVAERLAEALGEQHARDPEVERAQTLCVECGAAVRPLLIVLHMREAHGAA